MVKKLKDWEGQRAKDSRHFQHTGELLEQQCCSVQRQKDKWKETSQIWGSVKLSPVNTTDWLGQGQKEVGEEVQHCDGALVETKVNKKVRRKVQLQEEILWEQKERTQTDKPYLNMW